jgi:putative membrane protein
MKVVSTVTAAALLAAAAGVAAAQSPVQTPTQPDAASSPHQRQSTETSINEAPTTNGANPGAASTPHQHEAMQDASHSETEAAMTAGATPATFVADAAQTGLMEVQLAKMALQKTSNDEVKKFAQQMLQDHTQANQQLASIAKSKGIRVPTKLDAKHEAVVQNLSGMSGEAFDSAYAEHMAKGHAKAIALFQGAAQSSDADLAAFAQKTLPTLEVHKQLADNLRNNTSTRTASAPEAEHNK